MNKPLSNYSAFECIGKYEQHVFEPTGEFYCNPEPRIVFECIKCDMQVSEIEK